MIYDEEGDNLLNSMQYRVKGWAHREKFEKLLIKIAQLFETEVVPSENKVRYLS